MSICDEPHSSVLFDGIIPTLIGLDEDMWASQLFTIHRLSSSNHREIISNFAGTPGYVGVWGVKLVMFNCPEWGIAVQSVQLLEQQSSFLLQSLVEVGRNDHPKTSCGSLVTEILCLQQISVSTHIVLQFNLDQNSDWIHIAELTFYASTGTCQTAVISNTSPINMPVSTESSEF